MMDITDLPKTAKMEIAEYIKQENLSIVNSKIEKVHVKKSFYTKYGKRILDIIVSLFALLLTAPINLAIAVITLLDVGRPIIFKQQRIGRDGKKFTLFKFRNMTNSTDRNGELLPPSERVTKWGRFARKTSMDELLNFWSVLNGSMSIVGPRPILDYYMDRFNDRHKMRYAVRPGLECPSINRLNRPMSWQERLDNDIWYVENCSFCVDIKLCFRIVQMAFDRKATAQRASADYGGFMGYQRNGQVIYTKSVPDEFAKKYCCVHNFYDLSEAILAREIIDFHIVNDSVCNLAKVSEA